ncbi:MAG: class I SAM-dependent methyltransferase [Sinobacteraceae bacterium]|nr:class I SAM-dependent methyltransferase [Nevskiaceae bacterium]
MLENHPHSAGALYGGVDNLEVMRAAPNYYEHQIMCLLPWLKGVETAVDFGAGLGDFSRSMRRFGLRVLCVEPDKRLSTSLRQDGFEVFDSSDALVEALHSSSAPDANPAWVDFIYSLNVLEHIDDDETELRLLLEALRPGGTLFIYVPAFKCLYSAMDRHVGHCRRYTRRMLADRVTGAGFEVVHARYADSLGFFASLALRAVPGSDGSLSRRAVAFYDTFVFPLSRMLDLLCNRWFGKNLLLVARRPLSAASSSESGCG